MYEQTNITYFPEHFRLELWVQITVNWTEIYDIYSAVFEYILYDKKLNWNDTH